MIAYLAARLVALLYGLDWPLDKYERSFYAPISAFEFVLVSIVIIFVILCRVFGKDDGENGVQEGGAE
ncbi:MAG: hypothetical protein II840_04225 [Kiritimatiellae bacterium]|nr:hypothetical protein [Kiritimatiellia bacterium]